MESQRHQRLVPRPVRLEMRVIIVIVFAMSVSACQTLNFYRQAVGGQLAILEQRESTARLIADPDTNAALRERLVEVKAILQFGEQQLSLKPKHRYSSYVQIDSPYVVWNVFATPEFSTRPNRWCYPIVGCAAYRGYFHADEATRFARQLIVTQHDAVVGGVAAYSTLGWFDDPLLSTFVNWRSPELAGLLFHELAHGRVFIVGDASFNEALATFVERRGVFEWLRSQGDEREVARANATWEISDRFVRYLLGWRRELQHLYDQPYDSSARRLLKGELMAEIERCYRENRVLLGDGVYDDFFRQQVNNARLVPFATYHDLVAGFAGLFAESQQDWSVFFLRAGQLKGFDADVRTEKLRQFADAYSKNTVAVTPIRCHGLEYVAPSHRADMLGPNRFTLWSP
jgi:predicted aminopeptidase